MWPQKNMIESKRHLGTVVRSRGSAGPSCGWRGSLYEVVLLILHSAWKNFNINILECQNLYLYVDSVRALFQRASAAVLFLNKILQSKFAQKYFFVTMEKKNRNFACRKNAQIRHHYRLTLSNTDWVQLSLHCNCQRKRKTIQLSTAKEWQ